MDFTPSNIEELARTDELWRKVLEEESKTPQIKLFWLMEKITDVRVFVEDTIALYEGNGARMVARKMRIVPELISDPKFWKKPLEGTYSGESVDAVGALSHEIEKSLREKIEKHYPERVLNQGLVELCTIFDYFLDSALESLFLANPKILYGVAAAKNIELKTIVELGSVEAVIREISAKEIRTFSYLGISGRLEYFRTKLGIETSKLFDWGKIEDEKGKQLEGWNEKTLDEIYQKRHSIIHDTKSPMSKYSDLDVVADFILFISVNLASLLSDRHKILWDINMTMSRNDRYANLKTESGND